jgi:flagellar biosynthesis protein FliP
MLRSTDRCVDFASPGIWSPTTTANTGLNRFVDLYHSAGDGADLERSQNNGDRSVYANRKRDSWEEALDRGAIPIKRFMAKQIALAKNEQSVALFYQNLPDQSGSMSQSMSTNMPSDLQEVPLNVLLPAFLISELKVAFLLGFQIYLPFLILDLVVSSVTVSMGMMMLPPTMVSFPMKLILFVMVDGWNLVIGMLLQSFGPFT